METGGCIYWSELYPDVGELDGSDTRNILYSFEMKYELIDIVFKPLGKLLDFEIRTWEKYDLDVVDLPYLIDILKNTQTSKELVSKWLSRATEFVELALKSNKKLSFTV